MLDAFIGQNCAPGHPVATPLGEFIPPDYQAPISASQVSLGTDLELVESDAGSGSALEDDPKHMQQTTAAAEFQAATIQLLHPFGVL